MTRKRATTPDRERFKRPGGKMPRCRTCGLGIPSWTAPAWAARPLVRCADCTAWLWARRRVAR